MSLVRTTLFLPADLHRDLKGLAHEKGSSMAKLIQQAVKEVFFRKKKKSMKNLWGIAKNTRVSFEEFQDLKKSLHDKNL